MKNNATSGLPLSVCASICALIILIFFTDNSYAKRGCSAFGHSCFGGHGKRFDPNIREKILQDDDTITNREIEDLNSRNEFDVSEKKFGGQTEILSSQSRHQDSSRFNPFALSFIVRQWLTSHRLHQPDMELNNK
ncbi:hypothetical protein HZU73_01891 [Apis mellifera caucasica]|uniref:Uncharacterized protein LOC725573 n=1 Tax=Apis mellifera TaxID=7460 RepID=A0A7M7FYI6_APIME|nr:uncharacterized protein LOC725573 [Apis mellifera]KAG6803055.1 hypothetical protein HZU73_01891 [Apis mellifera caucasica]KAG9431782.1 hypothetical protein HZU67_06427 [Apis mellifera carnica]UYB77875.1 neuropeptide CCHamide-2 [Apis mellifera]|eukprot:XP_001120020.1 uncharacterized protein LOC725573 [Apis mellifera]